MTNIDPQTELNIPEVKLGDARILFLDASSSCTGYATLSVDFLTRKATLNKAGCVWFGADWKHAQKYSYIYDLIQNHFWVVEAIDHIVAEQYSINTKKMSGALVSPELHGVIKAAAYSNGLDVSLILPQTWRSQLGIKPLGEKGSRDYKTPTAAEVSKVVTVPETIMSNITNKPRALPSDVTDAIAISMGWAKKFGLEYYTKDVKFNDYIDYLGR